MMGKITRELTAAEDEFDSMYLMLGSDHSARREYWDRFREQLKSSSITWDIAIDTGGAEIKIDERPGPETPRLTDAEIDKMVRDAEAHARSLGISLDEGDGGIDSVAMGSEARAVMSDALIRSVEIIDEDPGEELGAKSRENSILPPFSGEKELGPATIPVRLELADHLVDALIAIGDTAGAEEIREAVKEAKDSTS